MQKLQSDAIGRRFPLLSERDSQPPETSLYPMGNARFRNAETAFQNPYVLRGAATILLPETWGYSPISGLVMGPPPGHPRGAPEAVLDGTAVTLAALRKAACFPWFSEICEFPEIHPI